MRVTSDTDTASSQASEQQRQEMISDGQTAALMVAKKHLTQPTELGKSRNLPIPSRPLRMAGTHALLLDEDGSAALLFNIQRQFILRASPQVKRIQDKHKERGNNKVTLGFILFCGISQHSCCGSRSVRLFSIAATARFQDIIRLEQSITDLVRGLAARQVHQAVRIRGSTALGRHRCSKRWLSS